MKIAATSFILFAALLSFTAFSQNKADDITGIWLTGGKEPAKIQVFKSGEKFYGKSLIVIILMKMESKSLIVIILMKKSEAT